MNRRQFTEIVGIGVTALLARCTSNNTGDGGEQPELLDGEWVLRANVLNEDDQPRDWRVESRAEDRESVAAAWGALPAGEETELALSGSLFEEQREVFVESDNGAISERWNPTECRRLFATISIVDGNPSMETECREE